MYFTTRDYMLLTFLAFTLLVG